jgi:hypothetical protein
MTAPSNGAPGAAAAISPVFEKLVELPRQVRLVEEPEKPVYVSDIIRNMFMVIEILVQHQKRRKPGFLNQFNPWADNELWGYNLKDVASLGASPMRSVKINKKQCGGWYELTKPDYGIAVFFGNNFGELIKYKTGQLICHHWESVPSGLHFLSAESKTLSYVCERFDSDKSLCAKLYWISAHGQKQCQKESWPCCNKASRFTERDLKATSSMTDSVAVVFGKVDRKRPPLGR